MLNAGIRILKTQHGDILFIKTSSLGDVIHHMPAVTDARRRRPGDRLACWWRRAFAPLVRLHPAVDEVVPVAWAPLAQVALRAGDAAPRSPPACWNRAKSHDEIIDSQGLLRTGVMSRFARAAAWLRQPQHQGTAGRRVLQCTSYRQPRASRRRAQSHPHRRGARLRAGGRAGLRSRSRDAGNAGPALRDFSCTPLRGWRNNGRKKNWIALGNALAGDGLALVLPWGTDKSGVRSERLAAALPNARVPENASRSIRWRVSSPARSSSSASIPGLLHLAAALGVPLVRDFQPGSDPSLTKPVGNGPLAVLGGAK